MADRMWKVIREVILTTTGVWRRASRWTKLLVLSIVAYGITFSILTTLRVFALSAFAYDLGVYHQSIYTTIFDHRFFYYTADLPANPGGSIFGVHFSPILILMLIPYGLVPSLFTLTIVQTWALALATIPVYFLGKRMLGSERIAFALALAYLLHPATQGVNWYDFHPQAFLPLALLAGVYFLEVRKWRYFVLCMAFALLTIEMAAFLVAVLVIGSLGSTWWWARRVGGNVERTELQVLLGVLSVSIAWVVLSRVVVLALNPHNVYYAGGSGFWTVLGASSILELPVQVISSPGRAVAALLYQAPLKLWYLFALFAPVLFLPFRSIRAMVYCSPWLAVSLFSNQPPFYVMGDQYPAFILPFIFYGAILGIAKPFQLPTSISRLAPFMRLRLASVRGGGATPIVLVTTTIAVLLVISPLGPLGLGVYEVGGWPFIGYHENAVDSLYQLIPRNASVLTTNNLMPLVSNRRNAFVVPLDNFYPAGSSFNVTMGELMGTVDYLLADFQTRPVEAAILFAWANRSRNFEVVGAGDGAVLLGRGGSGLVSFTPFVRSFDDTAVQTQDGSHVADPAAAGGVALRHSSGTTSDLWFGPYARLTPGVYEISYRLRVERPGAGPIVRLPVVFSPLQLVGTILRLPESGTRVGFELRLAEARMSLASFEVVGADVPSTGEYFWFQRTVVVTALGEYEFPGLDGVGGMGLWFDGFRIEQKTPFGWADVPTSWLIRDWPPVG